MPQVLSPPQSRVHHWTDFLHLNMSEAWKRFLLAILGLALAFGAAIFSRVSRESGDLWATLILASMALLLAGIVGLTTVPYLARRVAFPRVRDVFDYEVTKIGMVFCVAVIMIGIAALNTGNNLLYIIVATMLGAMLVSGLASAVTLRELELDVRLPDHVFAGKAVPGYIVLRNRRRWIPSLSISVLPPRQRKSHTSWRWEPETFSFPPGRSPERQWFSLPDRSLRRISGPAAVPPIFDGAVYFPFIGGKTDSSAELILRFPHRGRYRQDTFGISTRFPFSFLKKTRQVPLQCELIVYPSIQETDEVLEALPLISGEFETFVRGRGHDLYGIREYMPEDSARHVDWKATAKSGSPKVREFTREDERKLRIIFDNPGPRELSSEAYERSVSLAASLAWHFSAEDAELSFAAPGYQGGANLYSFLSFLGTIEAKGGKSIIDELHPTEEFNIIVTARPRGTIPTAIWSCSYILFVDEQASGGN